MTQEILKSQKPELKFRTIDGVCKDEVCAKPIVVDVGDLNPEQILEKLSETFLPCGGWHRQAQTAIDNFVWNLEPKVRTNAEIDSSNSSS